MQPKPLRSPWEPDFPAVLVHAPRSEVTTHPWYAAARSGDVGAAALLVADMLSGPMTDRLAVLGQGRAPLLACVHGQKVDGLNVLPAVLAQGLALLLGWDVDGELVQANIVDHTGDVGFGHLACQTAFDGRVEAGRAYVLVDDFIGQGGTIANLRGHIVRGGGTVLGATVLTGNASSAHLVPEPAALLELRDKHGNIESWWRRYFGFGFDCLTGSEVGFLVSNSDSDYIQARIEAAGCA